MNKASLLYRTIVTLVATGTALPILSAAEQPHAGPASSLRESEKPYIRNIVQLTNSSMGFVKAGEAYFSPDDKMIIFQATPEGKTEYQIYTMSLESRRPRMVSTGRGACTCAYFHPKKDKIIFASSHLDPDPEKEPAPSRGYEWGFDAYMDIYEANLDGSGLRRLTTADGYDAEGVYSPDGTQIVFTSQRTGDLELYSMNADGSNQRRLTFGAGYDGGPFFSPDGELILYRGDRRNDGKQNLQLRVIHADGSGDRAITDNNLFNWCPYWHPSGRFFIFTQTNHDAYSKGKRPNYDLFLTTLEGKEFIRVTHDPAFDGLAVFSHDGWRLLWTSKRNGLEKSQIFIADFHAPPDWPKQE